MRRTARLPLSEALERLETARRGLQQDAYSASGDLRLVQPPMPVRSGEQVQAALTSLIEGWRGYAGSERAEAQTFLNQLFDAYGSDLGAVGARLEDFTSSAGLMHLH